MNRQWMDKQKILANKASYRDYQHSRETPSEFFIRKKELLMRVYDYTDTQLIREIMDGTPISWINIVTPHLYADIDEFQEVVRYHENSLLQLSSTQPQPFQEYYHENTSPKPNYQKARVNLVGANPNLPPPQYPKDDLTVSKRQTPEAKGAHPCRHCGSGKHWDNKCKYSRRNTRRARMNHIVSTAEDEEAQQEYEDMFYGMTSEDESENKDF